MKLIWHILRKDLRHVRLHLLLLAAAGVIVYTLALQVVPPEDGQGESYGPSVCLYLYLALWISLIPAMLQADSPTGTTEFWRTRPISSKILFAAKSIEVCLALAYLLGGYSLFLFTQGFDAQQIISVLKGIAPSLAGVSIFVFLIASLTRGLGRFWFTFLALNLAGMLALIAWSLATSGISSATPLWMTKVPGGLWSLLGFVVALAIVAYQYLRRPAAQGWITLAVLVVIVSILYGFRVSGIESQFSSRLPPATWELQVAAGESRDESASDPFPGLIIRAVPPPGSVARMEAVFGQTTWSDGRSLEAEGISTTTYTGRVAAVQSALGRDYTVSEAGQAEEVAMDVTVVPSDGFSEAGNLKPTRFDGELYGTQLRYVPRGKVAVADGAALEWEGCKLVILQTPSHHRASRLSVRYQAQESGHFRQVRSGRPLFVLINRIRKEAKILPTEGRAERFERDLPGLDLLAIAWSFSPKDQDKRGSVVVDEKWLEEAELGVFSEHPERNVNQLFASVVKEEGGKPVWAVTTPPLQTPKKSRPRLIKSISAGDTTFEITRSSP